jgi:hypothetical protein
MAKPRVHEIASEFGVDSKTVLRMLREDGEFLKGPSSSMEPPVARRVRARLDGEGHLWQTPKIPPSPTSAVPRASVPASPSAGWQVTAPSQVPPIVAAPSPVPSPPGTRWPATEPFVAYTQPAAPSAVKARRAADTVARAEEVARANWQARRDEDAADAAQVKRAEQLASEHAARAERKKALQAKAHALLADGVQRDARGVSVIQPERLLTAEELRTNARQSVVTRADGNWEGHGFGAAERQTWERAGLSAFQAHVPAMCRAFGSRGADIKPGHLSTKLLSGLTVLGAIGAGDNIVQVMDQLAAVRPARFPASYGPRVATVVPALREIAPEKRHVASPPPRDLEAAGVPKLADYLISLTRPSQDERAVDTFNRERKQFERTGRPGPLVKLYAEAHGVFGDLNLTRKLLQNVPLHVANRAKHFPFMNLLTEALRERQFYYLTTTATLAVEAAADRRIPVPEEYDLPTPTGFALLRGPDQDGAPAGRILIWSHGAREMTATILSVADLVAGLTEYPTVRTAATGSVAGEGAERALALVAAVETVTRRPSSGDSDSDMHRAPQRPPGGTVKPRPAKRPVGESGELVDFVSLIHAPGEAHFEEAATTTGRKAETRWVVRGHWRQQWYSSQGERHPLWIKAHEAGAEEGPLQTGDRVRVSR